MGNNNPKQIRERRERKQQLAAYFSLKSSTDNLSPKPKSSYSDSKNEDGLCWLF
jgi:hypothetical protein